MNLTRKKVTDSTRPHALRLPPCRGWGTRTRSKPGHTRSRLCALGPVGPKAERLQSRLRSRDRGDLGDGRRAAQQDEGWSSSGRRWKEPVQGGTCWTMIIRDARCSISSSLCSLHSKDPWGRFLDHPCSQKETGHLRGEVNFPSPTASQDLNLGLPRPKAELFPPWSPWFWSG